MRCLAAGVVLLVAVVSGCSAGEAAPAEVGPLASGSASAGASVEASASAGVSAAPEATPTTTAASSEAPDAVPAEAQAPTAKGASAFTKHFFATVNRGYAERDATPVRRLSAPQCNSCVSIMEDIERLRRSNVRVDGRRFILQFAEAAPSASDGSIFVDFRFSSDAYVEQRPDGLQGDSFPAAAASDGQARLVRGKAGWLLSGLRLVEAP